MKDLLSKLLLGVALCGFASCANEVDEFAPQGVERADIEVINGGEILRFKDNKVYDEILQKVSKMTDKERVSYFSSLSFKPQTILMEEADTELRDICESTSVLDVAEKRYSDFKQKYGKVFLFNDSDASDLSPYSRLVSPSNEFFANVKGQFLIGDSLVECAVFQSFSRRLERTQNVMTRDISPSTAVNEAYSRQSDRKVGTYLSLDGQYIIVNFTAQKKTWFGWVRYSTVYSGEYLIRGAGFEFAQGDILGMYPSYVNMDGRPFSINSREFDGNYTTRFGRKTSGGTCTGNMAVWSRGISYEDRGYASINL